MFQEMLAAGSGGGGSYPPANVLFANTIDLGSTFIEPDSNNHILSSDVHYVIATGDYGSTTRYYFWVLSVNNGTVTRSYETPGHENQFDIDVSGQYLKVKETYQSGNNWTKIVVF